jgi:hypothetical protein
LHFQSLVSTCETALQGTNNAAATASVEILLKELVFMVGNFLLR